MAFGKIPAWVKKGGMSLRSAIKRSKRPPDYTKFSKAQKRQIDSNAKLLKLQRRRMAKAPKIGLFILLLLVGIFAYFLNPKFADWVNNFFKKLKGLNGIKTTAN